MNNLELWEKVEKTNPAHTKEVNLGRKFTAIDAYQQIKNATAVFGEYGDKWGLKEFEINEIPVNENLWLAKLKGKFYHPNGEFEISASMQMIYKTSKGSLKVEEDYTKKLYTDALTKALSYLGFNADVFTGKFDDNKYVSKMRVEFTAEEEPSPKKTEAKPEEKKVSKATYEKFLTDNYSEDELKKLLKTHKVSEIKYLKYDLTKELAVELRNNLKKEGKK